jgi:hypothetical protein
MDDVRGAGIYTNLIGNWTELAETQNQKAINVTHGYADFAAGGVR